jgi:hypothetical protein
VNLVGTKLHSRRKNEEDEKLEDTEKKFRENALIPY